MCLQLKPGILAFLYLDGLDTFWYMDDLQKTNKPERSTLANGFLMNDQPNGTEPSTCTKHETIDTSMLLANKYMHKYMHHKNRNHYKYDAQY